MRRVDRRLPSAALPPQRSWKRESEWSKLDAFLDRWEGRRRQSETLADYHPYLTEADLRAALAFGAAGHRVVITA